jgi:glycine oxidase ThiO
MKGGIFLLLNLALRLQTSFSFSVLSTTHTESLRHRESFGLSSSRLKPHHLLSPFALSSTTSPFDISFRSKILQQKDVVIIGGGLAGLSAALYLSQIDPSRHITILEREIEVKSTVASFAAAGMLAPQAERLPVGPLLDLCLASRQCYREFVDLVEGLAEESGEEGKSYLMFGDGKVGYMSSGGFLAPAFAGDAVATWSPSDRTAKWLDATQVRELEPSLSKDVIGGWWFPEDASVDARKLTCALRAACVAAGVEMKIGKEFEVSSLDLLDGECRGLYLASGKYLRTKTVLVANGAWMRQLLPIPIEPHKGQSLSLRMPSDKPPLLKRVLFAQDSYIVPKSDGRIVVGATVEAGSFDPHVTPMGIMHILHYAIQLIPGLADLPIEETWVGLRPTTPDKGPILGKTDWNNLFLAGGYWRNGVLLAPKTGQMLAQLIAGQSLSPADQELLDAFSWDRFITPEGSKQLEMNSRFAASMYPVHRRAEGSGVAVAVGTELGSYSTAKSAKNERSKDRAALFGSLDESLEKAADLGKADSSAFSGLENRNSLETFGSFHLQYDENVKKSSLESMSYDNKAIQVMQAKRNYETAETGRIDINDLNKINEEVSSEISSQSDLNGAIAPSTEAKSGFEGRSWNDSISEKTAIQLIQKEAGNATDKLDFIYQKIRSNKATISQTPNEDVQSLSKPDPGFRIHYVVPETRELIEIPPYTNSDDLSRIIANYNQKKQDSQLVHQTHETNSQQGYSETSFDGYSIIEAANARDSREAELKAMRAARQLNRNIENVDTSRIGAQRGVANEL